MTFASSVGIIAAFLTTTAFVPQVVRVIRTRDTHPISLWMYLLFSAGVALWLAYGLMLMLWPVILANSVTLLLALVVIYFKLQEGRHSVPRAPQAG
jgi:MtN3 and saliva related transmembrane protein